MHITLLIALFALAMAGTALSLHLAVMFRRVQRGESVQCLDTACPLVMRTPYAAALRFPNWYLALPFYGGLAVFALLRLSGLAAWLLPVTSLAVALAFILSVYLVYALLVKLRSP